MKCINPSELRMYAWYTSDRHTYILLDQSTRSSQLISHSTICNSFNNTLQGRHLIPYMWLAYHLEPPLSLHVYQRHGFCISELRLSKQKIKPTLCLVPDSKVHGANIWPTWVLLAPVGPHVGPMNLAIRGVFSQSTHVFIFLKENSM